MQRKSYYHYICLIFLQPVVKDNTSGLVLLLSHLYQSEKLKEVELGSLITRWPLNLNLLRSMAGTAA